MKKSEEIYIGDPFVIQVHLNKKCPLDCSYCYLRDVKESYINESSLEKFLNYFNILSSKHKFYLNVGLTGGDLFLHPKTEQICKFICTLPSIKKVSLLVNTLWHENAYKIILLLKNKLDVVQVKTDVIGSRIEDVLFLKDNNIKTVAKIMLAKNNDIERQLKIIRKLQKINQEILVSVDRFCPQSIGEDKYLISRNDLVWHIKKIKNEFPFFATDDPLVRSILGNQKICDTNNDSAMYGCIIPNGGLAVFPSGKIKLCARIPQFETGFNIKNFDLIKYIKTFKYIRNKIKKDCGDCVFAKLCSGGCIATSFNFNREFSRDAQCVNNF